MAESDMIGGMGSFRIDVEIGNPSGIGARQTIRNVLVDTGAELSCFPADVLDAVGIVRGKQVRFRQADGSVLIRWTGSGIVYAVNTYATDDLVFGEAGDLCCSEHVHSRGSTSASIRSQSS